MGTRRRKMGGQCRFAGGRGEHSVASSYSDDPEGNAVFAEHLSRAFAVERQKRLLDEATAAHAVRQARAAADPTRRRAADPIRALSSDAERVLLRDGTAVVIRTVEASDGPLLFDGFARLSLRSRYARFFTAKPQLTAAEVRYFTDVDHYDHDAIGALDPVTGRGIGIARFVRSRTDAQSADVAVTVVDEWHRRGVGTELLLRLAARARRVGIYAFTAMVHADNEAMISLLRNGHPGVELTGVDGDVLEYEIGLTSFSVRSRAADTPSGRGVAVGC